MIEDQPPLESTRKRRASDPPSYQDSGVKLEEEKNVLLSSAQLDFHGWGNKTLSPLFQEFREQMASLSLRQNETVLDARGIVSEVADVMQKFRAEQVELQRRFIQENTIARQNELLTASLQQKQGELKIETDRRVADISQQIAMDNATARQREQQTIFLQNRQENLRTDTERSFSQTRGDLDTAEDILQPHRESIQRLQRAPREHDPITGVWRYPSRESDDEPSSSSTQGGR